MREKHTPITNETNGKNGKCEQGGNFKKSAFLSIFRKNPIFRLTPHRQRIVKTALSFLALGFIYFLWIQITHLTIPCPFRTITGFKCPGCGITTLILSLAKLDVQRAFRANPFLFVTGPLLLIQLVYFFILQWTERTLPKWNEIGVILYGILLCIFGIYRNF